MTVEDEVSYKNLATGREYTVTGTLMDSETGEPLKDADGNAVTASTTFEPEDTEGKVKVTLSYLDPFQQKLVVFEKLEADGNVIGTRRGPYRRGADRRGHPAQIKMSAADGADGDKEVTADGKATIVDTVKYTGLVPGTEYELQGTLMDAETGGALKGGRQGDHRFGQVHAAGPGRDPGRDLCLRCERARRSEDRGFREAVRRRHPYWLARGPDRQGPDGRLRASRPLRPQSRQQGGEARGRGRNRRHRPPQGPAPGQSYTLTASINKKADGTQLTLADAKDALALAGNGIQKGSDTAESGSDLSKALVDVTGTGSFANIPEGAKLTKNDDGLTAHRAGRDAGRGRHRDEAEWRSGETSACR